MADTNHKHDEIEKGIAEALKPVGDRPRVFPVYNSEPPGQAPLRGPDNPVKTVVQFLTDMEQQQVGTDDRIVRLEKSLAEILGKIHERLAAIENSIGVR